MNWCKIIITLILVVFIMFMFMFSNIKVSLLMKYWKWFLWNGSLVVKNVNHKKSLVVNYKFTKFPFMWPMTQNLMNWLKMILVYTGNHIWYMYDASWNQITKHLMRLRVRKINWIFNLISVSMFRQMLFKHRSNSISYCWGAYTNTVALIYIKLYGWFIHLFINIRKIKCKDVNK